MIRVKAIKLRVGDKIGARFKECREFKGLKASEIDLPYYPDAFENDQFDNPRLSTIVRYAKAIGLKQVRFILSDNGKSLRTNPESVGGHLKSIRMEKGLTQKDILNSIGRGVSSQGALSNIEGYRDSSSSVLVYTNYAKAIGVKELIIDVDG